MEEERVNLIVYSLFFIVAKKILKKAVDKSIFGVDKLLLCTAMISLSIAK